MMIETRWMVSALRVLLAVAFAVTVLFQTVSMPGQLAHLAREDPGLGGLRWVLLAFVIAELLCVQVVIVCTWRLLGLVRAERIFTEQAFGWVDAILAAMALAWSLLAALSLYLVLRADDPGDAIALFAVDVAGGVVVLLMAVLRTLLRQATVLRTDLETVI